MTALTILSGSLAIDHQPVGAQTVLIINSTADSILYSGKSDSSGSFLWEFPRELAGSKVFVLARFRTANVLTSKYCEIILTDKAEFDFDVNSAELENLSVEIKGEKELPKEFRLNIFAVKVDGIPDQLSTFLPMESQSVGGIYYEEIFHQPNVNLKIGRGTYYINASYFIMTNPQIPKPRSENFTTIKAESNGQLLQGGNGTGFKFEMASTTNVVLTMRRTED